RRRRFGRRPQRERHTPASRKRRTQQQPEPGTPAGAGTVAARNSRRPRGTASSQIPLSAPTATGHRAMIRLLVICLLTLLSPLAHAALEASVDRTRLIEGESLELTLESPAVGRLSELDLSPLAEHFEVQRSRQLSLVSKVDGRTTPVTRWVITLRPLRTGFLVVPPVDLGQSSSQPISLHVLSATQAAADQGAQLAPVFIDSEVDIENPYVQAQVLLTLRIYHSVSLFDDSSLSGL